MLLGATVIGEMQACKNKNISLQEWWSEYVHVQASDAYSGNIL
jgi:hypothetical protein